LGDVDKPNQLQAGYKTLMGFNEPGMFYVWVNYHPADLVDLQLEGVAVKETADAAATA
jgi:hypothetical protein